MPPKANWFKKVFSFFLFPCALAVVDLNVQNPVYLYDGSTFLHVQNDYGNGQGCQIFLGPSIPKREKYTK
jgi:hypothetical protein